ncbi:hypothetical protein FEM48_Zijuj06G0106100 [Ziziphus jujuba var. spinosa]|uniref:PHD-type zinc finger plants domain-containing protein n=1 Tax=Ziziphus jujuba var. spinosa TaxID=714518 RepID=A0A978V8S7_ZIZJJ|nr:hypothetical protein FEM48_Zijuj06G0106100 [Ziziphus jujuba var. spinosa]
MKPNKNKNMTSTKSNPPTTSQPTSQSQSQPHECCMCGDYGFSHDLFKCKLCHFRSQHRYCSNLYPNAESYHICNWCLSQKEDTKEKSQNSSNSSSSCRNDAVEFDGESYHNKKKTNPAMMIKQQLGGPRSLGVSTQLQLNGPIKKPKSIEAPPPSPSLSPSPSLPVSVSTRKRIITNGAKEEKLRRTRSEEISKGGITKHVFRNKVRRYKLLDEVSS